MFHQSLYHTYKRYRTLQTDRIHALPIVTLMPHGACNCRCIMCDIWKDNHHLRQLTEADVVGLLDTFRKFGTKQVLMSGGEALLHPNFFRFCQILNENSIKVSLLSTGLTLKRNAADIVRHISDVIVSIDGDEANHDRVRNIPGAFNKIREGVGEIRSHRPAFQITGRSVIHKNNFKIWNSIIDSSLAIGLDQISFLPADVTSHAFNREILWNEARQHEILPDEYELEEIKWIIECLIAEYQAEFKSGYIAESPDKLMNIYYYYAAFYGLNKFPFKRCNAPWVSTVIEADGSVRPCFFHPVMGNIRQESLEKIVNSDRSIRFRKNLDIDEDPTCIKCVCYLNLPPRIAPGV